MTGTLRWETRALPALPRTTQLKAPCSITGPGYPRKGRMTRPESNKPDHFPFHHLGLIGFWLDILENILIISLHAQSQELHTIYNQRRRATVSPKSKHRLPTKREDFLNLSNSAFQKSSLRGARVSVNIERQSMKITDVSAGRLLIWALMYRVFPCGIGKTRYINAQIGCGYGHTGAICQAMWFHT